MRKTAELRKENQSAAAKRRQRGEQSGRAIDLFSDSKSGIEQHQHVWMNELRPGFAGVETNRATTNDVCAWRVLAFVAIQVGPKANRTERIRAAAEWLLPVDFPMAERIVGRKLGSRACAGFLGLTTF
jgi:hypothetical protein